MRKQVDQSTDAYVQRHLSQIKILARLVEHELEAGKQNPTLTLDREMVENLLDLLEIFVDDLEAGGGGARRERAEGKQTADGKPQVTRLN